MNRQRCSKRLENILFLIFCTASFSSLFLPVIAEPVGPTVTMLSNTTKSPINGTAVNSTMGDESARGYIFTMGLNSVQQNIRWKGYVGNVTGTFTLDDADDYTLFEWTITAVAGEVYATRGTNINWSNINCTWRAEGLTSYVNSNRTVEELENKALNHTNLDDNITATFTKVNHSQLIIGSLVIEKNKCFSAQMWQNDAEQSFTDSDNANFTQVLLYDGTNSTNGNLIYETKIEGGKEGYNPSESYDFQMILPENGLPVWTGSIGYYFYVELS